MPITVAETRIKSKMRYHQKTELSSLSLYVYEKFCSVFLACYSFRIRLGR